MPNNTAAREPYTRGEIAAILVGGLFALPLGGAVGMLAMLALYTYLPH